MSPDLGMGITSPSFHLSGKIPCVRERLNMCVTSGVSTEKASFIIKLLMFSNPDDLEMLISLITLKTSVLRYVSKPLSSRPSLSNSLTSDTWVVVLLDKLSPLSFTLPTFMENSLMLSAT